jgi:Icc-related predicted phosphoesterase
MESREEVLLAVVGDVHAHWRRLDAVLERISRADADGILLVGDLGAHELAYVRTSGPERDTRYLGTIEELFRRVGELGLPFAWVPGNHDVAELAGPGNADGRAVDVAGLRVAGIGGAGPGRFGFPYEWEEDHVRALALPPCDVILSHTPPARTPLDRVHGRGLHVGSEAVRERALAHDGALVCGHIHESPGAVQLGRCLCLNPGGLGAPFGRAQVGFLRRSPALAGQWEAVHEDLGTGAVRRWERAPATSG